MTLTETDIAIGAMQWFFACALVVLATEGSVALLAAILDLRDSPRFLALRTPRALRTLGVLHRGAVWTLFLGAGAGILLNPGHFFGAGGPSAAYPLALAALGGYVIVLGVCQHLVFVRLSRSEGRTPRRR